MTHDEFIGHVASRAMLGSREDAERATRVVLEALGERLAGGEPWDAASQLPPAVGQYLVAGLAGIGDPMNLPMFLTRIAQEEGIDIELARQHAQAVMSVLADAVSAGERRDLLAQLPADFEPLFSTAGSARY